MSFENSIIYSIPEHSSTAEFLKHLEIISTHENDLFTDKYQQIVKDNDNLGDKPFLSVVSRTQGKRPEMLREMLLSLNGQTDDDFEIVLIGHKLDEAGEKNVSCILEELDVLMRNKVRYYTIDYGNRTAPLNYGFASAKGEYISILDDDDIVFDNWVEEFHKKSEGNYGKILHSYVLEQTWELVSNNGTFLRAVDAPKSTYCRDFDIHEQVRMNHCPVMGLAFPSFYYKKMGLIFDESLTTTEDWDYLMRLAFIAGVEDIQTPTAIYRIWNNSNTSRNEHSDEEWTKNYATILEKFRYYPEIIPSGTDKLVVYDDYIGNWTNKNDVKSLFKTNRLYLAVDGKAYSEENSVTTTVTLGVRNRIALKYLIPEELQMVNCARFDPCEKGDFFISSVCTMVLFEDGTSIKMAEKWTNGFSTGDGTLFCGRDPQVVVFSGNNKKVTSIEVSFSVSINNLGEPIRKAILYEVEKKSQKKLLARVLKVFRRK